MGDAEDIWNPAMREAFAEFVAQERKQRMPDITMCSGEQTLLNTTEVCPKRESCWRYLAEPTPGSQSYFIGMPYDPKRKECLEYWDTEDLVSESKAWSEL